MTKTDIASLMTKLGALVEEHQAQDERLPHSTRTHHSCGGCRGARRREALHADAAMPLRRPVTL